jgi:carboxyl-terminal processing protease
MKKNKYIFVLGFILFSALGFGIGFITSRSIDIALAIQKSDPDQYKVLKTFTDVIGLVEKNYVEPIDFDRVVEGAIKGMLTVLDPHTSYMNKDLYKSLKEETTGEFGGLGIEINVKDQMLTVVSPIEDSPAFRVGVKSGDQIVKIGDEFTKNLSLEDAVKKMRGPKGTPVKIFVQRKGIKNLLPFLIVRDVIKVKSVRYRNLGPSYGYIRLAQFQDDSSAEFHTALEKLGGEDGKKLKGLIVDVRNNPGGLLNEAIRISDLFLKEDVVVYTEGRLESQKQKYYAHDDGNEPDYPIILLVNEGSASASEIVAGALQDHKRALVLGKQTFGKGSVQTVLPMEDGDALRLTTALYYTKNGRSIQAEGIKPDLEVELKPLKEEKEKEGVLLPRIKEKDLPGAIKNPVNKDENAPLSPDSEIESETPQEPLTIKSFMEMNIDELLKIDNQISEALKLLKEWDASVENKSRPTDPATQMIKSEKAKADSPVPEKVKK